MSQQKEVIRADEKEIKALEKVMDEEYRAYEKAAKEDKDFEKARELLASNEEKRKALDKMRELALDHVNGKQLNKSLKATDLLDKKGLFIGLKNN